MHDPDLEEMVKRLTEESITRDGKEYRSRIISEEGDALKRVFKTLSVLESMLRMPGHLSPQAATEVVERNLIFFVNAMESLDIMKVSVTMALNGKRNISMSLLRSSLESGVNGAFFNHISKNLEQDRIKNLPDRTDDPYMKRFLQEVMNYNISGASAVSAILKAAGKSRSGFPSVFKREHLYIMEREFLLFSPMEEDAPESYAADKKSVVWRYVNYEELSRNVHESLFNTDFARKHLLSADEKIEDGESFGVYAGFMERVADSIALLCINTYKDDVRMYEELLGVSDVLLKKEIYDTNMKYTAENLLKLFLDKRF